MSDLTELRRIAEAATRTEWSVLWETDEYDAGMPERWAGGILGPHVQHMPALGVRETAELDEADAEHIATFDPPTVLALLDRLERAEKTIADTLAHIDNHWLSPFRPGEAGYELRAILAGYEQTTNRENGSRDV